MCVRGGGVSFRAFVASCLCRWVHEKEKTRVCIQGGRGSASEPLLPSVYVGGSMKEKKKIFCACVGGGGSSSEPLFTSIVVGVFNWNLSC